MMLAANPYTQQPMKTEPPEDGHASPKSADDNHSVATSSEPSTPTISAAPISNGPSSSSSIDTPSTNVSAADLMAASFLTMSSPQRSQPIDLSAVFGSSINAAAFQDADKNPILDPNLFATALGAAPQFGLNMPFADTSTLMQLSQLFAAQHQQQLQQQIQQQQQLHDLPKSEQQKPQTPTKAPAQQQQMQSPDVANGGNEKKRVGCRAF